MAYTLIETVTVGSGGASSIEFTGIPQESGANLVVKLSLRAGEGAAIRTAYVRFNGDSGNSYSFVRLTGDGSTASSSKGSANDWLTFAYINGAGSTANTFDSQDLTISNYTSTAAKSTSTDSVTENNATEARAQILAGSWSGTAAITSMEFFTFDTFVEGSTASLYLVTTADAAGASTPVPKATGGSISLSGGYWIHSFTSSGTFTPTEDLTGVEYVVLAGGGNGGGNYQGSAAAGAGGAGGYRSSVIGESSGGGGSAESTVSATASTGYVITVGAGGSGVDGNTSGNSGSNSSAFSITSTGGGGGGKSGFSTAGKSGGSGGGGSSRTPTSTTGTGGGGGSGTTNQGFAGGAGGNDNNNNNNMRGGGGGGAGGAGVGFPTDWVDGGVGLTTSITGSAVKLAGGGQGGFFIQGNPTEHDTSWGGGTYSNGYPGYQRGAGSGTYAKGAGGGGGCDPYTGGSGGSGIVIVRYAA
jgi:hypothetical protein